VKNSFYRNMATRKSESFFLVHRVITKVLENHGVRRFASSSSEKKLFTPGPLGVSQRVKEVMLRDVGSRDTEFINCVRFIREELLRISGFPSNKFTTIPMQGSGTFALESMVATSLNRKKDKLIVFENGSYGQRLAALSKRAGIPTYVSSSLQSTQISERAVEKALENNPDATAIAVVHCETSSGVINPVEDIIKITRKAIPDCTVLVDAMSSFGAVPLQTEGIDYMVSSANKCIQGVPGFSFVIGNKEKLLECRNNCHSVSLDLVEQHDGLERNGQFRFTPPTHAMLAFQEALLELEEEGGIEARFNRYAENHRILNLGMEQMGFQTYINPNENPLSVIIASFHYPQSPKFSFEEFYKRLYELGSVIYPGKVSEADCFRIGTIGDIHSSDVEQLLDNIRTVCFQMDLNLS